MTVLSTPQSMRMSPDVLAEPQLTQRERELGAIIDAYNKVTEQLREAHEQLSQEVIRLREELEGKNRQLQRRERLAALGELAAGVAHEIRNPLGGIMLFASLLAQDVKDRPKALEVVHKIMRGVGSLESIVTDILEFGRPSSAEPKRISLGTLVQETVELASPQIERFSVRVDVLPELADVELMTDPAMLQRALLNLLINAVEAASLNKQEGRVRIQCGPSDDENVSIVIEDNGPGIPADLIDRVFNPFFTTRDEGTGLGLSIVHQVAETLGGGVTADSGEDGGAVFTLRVLRELRED